MSYKSFCQILYATAVFICIIISFSNNSFASQDHNKNYDNHTIEKESTKVSSISGPIKKKLILKPFLIFGYNLQEIFTRDNEATDPFFTDLSKFHNWRIGIGLRVTSFLSIELMYSSMARTYVAETTDIGRFNANVNKPEDKNINMFSNMIFFVGTFYTPPIDIGFGTLEFTGSAGIVGLFGFTHTAKANNSVIHEPAGPQLMIGLGMVIGLPKFISFKVFAELITLNNNFIGTPVALNYGIAINVYLL